MITIGIPAYNEESNLEACISTILKALSLIGKQIAIDILVVNDGSNDKTKNVIHFLENNYNFIRSIHHETNKGIGYTFKEIIKEARGEKLILIPGDNILNLSTVFHFIRCAENINADIVFFYFVNRENRKRSRVVLSTLFNLICTSIFDVNLLYLNGSGVYNTKQVQSIDIKSNGYFIAAEINLKLLLQGASFYEYPAYLKPNSTKSSALKLKNLIDIILSFLRLYYELRIKNKRIYSKKPLRIYDEGLE